VKRVLITGATGFLGGYVVDEFHRNGYHIVAAGRNKEKLGKLKRERVDLWQGDLSDLSGFTKSVYVVVHVAALSTIWGSWNDFYENNVTGTQNVIDFCNKNKVKRLVFISSPSVYSGKGDRFNIKEADYDPRNSLNDYIKTKLLAEKLVREANTKTLQTTILRPRGLFGVGETSIVPRLLKANDTIGIPLFNKGQNLVDMTCVENVAYAARLAAKSRQAPGKTYNITNGEPREFRTILETLFRKIGKQPRYKHPNLNTIYLLATIIESLYKLLHIHTEPPITRYTVCTLGYSQTLDISKAKRELGYAPILSLDEGIKKYATAYKAARS
jgi:nucleoside-diphosphate-sugar epimerase